MSFFYTTEQIRNRTKTVTRRLGWRHAKAGEIINACVKCQGLGRGGKIERICQIRVTDVRREPLSKMDDDLPSPNLATYGDIEATKEGFPGMTGAEFVSMFCKHMKCLSNEIVTRIEFEYVDG